MFGIYLLFFLWLIYRHALFGICRDEIISKKQFALLFLGKALAVPTFYLVFKTLYGGVELFDAGKFHHDACVIADYAWKDPKAYLRLMLGLQDDRPGSYDFVSFLAQTDNWDNGKLRDFLYNDNRVVIRVHSFFHFITFGSYFAQALFNCMLSFIGLVALYKSFRQWFRNGELPMLLILCFFPALWFYTGGVLKEGIMVFVLGNTVYLIHKAFTRRISLPDAIFLVFLLFVSLFLKPYVLLFCSLCFALYFYLNKFRIRFRFLLFTVTLSVLFILTNYAAIPLKGQSVVEAVRKHQKAFADASQGGIFLLDSSKFVRLAWDSTLVKKAQGGDSLFTIAKQAAFTYWEHKRQQDTLYCKANKDTVSVYHLVYIIPQSRSNIDPGVYNKGPVGLIGAGLFYSVMHPFFINAQGPIQLLASFENLLIVLSLCIIAGGLASGNKIAFMPLVLVFMALCVCLLIGIATPNAGAIFRYRSPVAIFILLAAYYFLIPTPEKNNTISN